MDSKILLALALLPAFALMMYVRRLDKIEKEPKELIIQLLIFGALTVVSAFVLEKIGMMFLDLIFPETTVLSQFIEYFLVVALVEEMGKFLVLRLRTWKNPNFNYTYDGIVYAVAASLGFAALENILYVFLNGGVPTAIARALTAVPAHCMFGVFMGYFYAAAKRAEFWGYPRKKYWNLFLACLVPILVHGFYDFTISVDWWGAAVLFLAFYVVCVVIAFIRIRTMSRDDQPIGFYPEQKNIEPPAPPQQDQPFYPNARPQVQQPAPPQQHQPPQQNPYATQYQPPQQNPYAPQYQSPQQDPYATQYQPPQQNPYATQYQPPRPAQSKQMNSYDSLYRPPTSAAPAAPEPTPEETFPSYMPDPAVPSFAATPELPEATDGTMPELPADVLDQVDLSKLQ